MLDERGRCFWSIDAFLGRRREDQHSIEGAMETRRDLMALFVSYAERPFMPSNWIREPGKSFVPC